MNRFVKKFRVFAGFSVLLNLAALFLPMIRRIQENYADVTWSQLDYIQSAFGKLIPALAKEGVELTTEQCGWIFLFMILPLILSVAAGVWSMVGSSLQKGSSILIFGVLLLYIGMAATTDTLWPELAEGQKACSGAACTFVLIFSGCGAVLSIAALIATPRKVKVSKKDIPQVTEIKQQQVEVRYNIMMEEQQKQQSRQEPSQKTEHGVLVGINGIYAGAEIPLTDGNYILLGRSSSNHLVFEGQPMVSREHCCVKWDEKRQKYIFRDYSANGSFANGAKDCLPQNLDIELAPGTKISLGDESNTFCLR